MNEQKCCSWCGEPIEELPVVDAGMPTEVRGLGGGADQTFLGGTMKDNIMFIPALVLAVAEVAALVVMVRGWRKDRRANDA